ncbi:hypothetical protein A33K_17334 [Burkholderia humptydooensis MSMB43]|uniref:Uncharacterized protein n=1 Tax=Burkholderia humptydooensis MSMB43 TaxID=441157 RepID=A0ABN0G1W2_9BURK|nr:hypothetical protein A33K_17334 [Burkholderia humptydooensis MSMB43]
MRVIGGVDAGGRDIPVANVANRLARERATRRQACGDGRYVSQFIRRQTAHRTSGDWTATRSAGALWPTLGDRQSATVVAHCPWSTTVDFWFAVDFRGWRLLTRN